MTTTLLSGVMSRLSYTLGRKGQLNYPGITFASKKCAESLLLKDAETHHCFFRTAGLHNHLSHHILAAYDLGAPAGLLQKIYHDEARIQRPIIWEEKDKAILVTEDNWVQYLGNPSAYASFVKFFAEQIEAFGSTATLERFVFDSEKSGAHMLARLMSGALHPLIIVGYGAEFANDTIIATGLAQTAVHNPVDSRLFKFQDIKGATSTPKGTGRQPVKGLSLLEILRQVYDSDILRPVLPYDPDALINARLKAALNGGRAEEIVRICSQYQLSETAGEDELKAKVEEVMWVATLLMAGTGKEGRKPRLDFFLMHIVTSSLFLLPILNTLKKTVHRADILRSYIAVLVLLLLSRGRPRINPELLMSYTDTPRPPIRAAPSKSALGNPQVDEDYTPWPAMVEDVLYAPDSHVVKTLRTLLFAAQHYGDTPPGGAIGAFRPGEEEVIETHNGTSKMDGTIFSRAAGLVMDSMGWVTHGQPAGEWDRSALGWDAAWDSGD